MLTFQKQCSSSKAASLVRNSVDVISMARTCACVRRSLFVVRLFAERDNSERTKGV